MKQVAMVTAKEFGFIYLSGIPYNPAKVRRFVGKGAGIKLQDLVIFDADEDRVLSYIKNALYMDTVEEKRMVREFVKASELRRAQMNDFDGVSREILKELAEEGIVITNEGVFTTPAEGKIEPKEFDPAIDINPELHKLLAPDQKRTMSILLQSSLKVATDVVIYNADEGEKISPNEIKEVALELAMWVDKNSTEILTNDYIQKVLKK